MEIPAEPKSWRDELAMLVEDSGLRLAEATPAAETEEGESLKDQIKGFAQAWGEMALDLGRGCMNVLGQTILTENCYIVKKTNGLLAEVCRRLSFMNEFLPEDRDPLHAWTVIFFVFVLALAVLNVNSRYETAALRVKRVLIHPPSAARILLPDGRYLAYHEIGVPADKAKFALIIPHGFLSSRLAGIPGIKGALLEEFGVRLVSYDLPGFGESDPHPDRNLNSSALDMEHLADSVGIEGKFWVMGYSSSSLHAWAALKYIPHKVAGAAMLAPLVNPYDRSMTKEEMTKAWENWLPRKKFYYYLARRFPKLLGYFYRRTFLSGKHGQIDKWLSVSLGMKDQNLVEEEAFEELWHRDVEELVRQGKTAPFLEEAVLLVSNWDFSLMDLQMQTKCHRKGFFAWLQFMYGQPECELTGFLGSIHVWQGMEDKVTPPSMTDYVARVLPNASIHRLPDEGHFSYFFLCDECHRKILSTLFGFREDPIDTVDKTLAKESTEKF